MTNFFDSNGPRGYLEIIKTQDGVSETIFADHNDICIGMGQTLAGLFDPGNTGKTIDDYKISYFQMGKAIGTGASATRECSSALTSPDYGATTNLTLTYRDVYSDPPKTQVMAQLGPGTISRSGDDKVTYSVTLDENTANTTLSEIALLSSAPIQGNAFYSPIVAYRTFPTITKTSSFTLTINWTIEF